MVINNNYYYAPCISCWFTLKEHLQISLSNPPEARVWPSGEKRTVKISPSCPVRSMIGAARLDVLAVDYKTNMKCQKMGYLH